MCNFKMQLYVVTWKFETSEYQTFARQALVEHVEDNNETVSYTHLRAHET